MTQYGVGTHKIVIMLNCYLAISFSCNFTMPASELHYTMSDLPSANFHSAFGDRTSRLVQSQS